MDLSKSLIDCAALLSDSIMHELAEHATKPIVVAVTGLQGSGKSTLANEVSKILTRQKVVTETVSLDDFYVPRSRRKELAKEVHPLCISRGVPGTHSAEKLYRLLAKLKCGFSTPIYYPIFNKYSDDRSLQKKTIKVSPDVILFEGWCVGFKVDDEAEWMSSVTQFELENDPDLIWLRWSTERLKEEYYPIWDFIDYQVFIATDSFEQVIVDRYEQEVKSNVSPMTHTHKDLKEVEHFVRHYQKYSEAIIKKMPFESDFVIKKTKCRQYSVVLNTARQYE